MNRVDDELVNLYGELNRGHDDLRERLLAQLTDFPTSPSSSADRDRKVHPWFISSAAGVAAALLLSVAVWVVLAWSPTLTLAQVKTAVLQQKWALLAYDNGEEHWISLLDGRRFTKWPNGRAEFWAPEVWQQYLPPDSKSPPSMTGYITEVRATEEDMKRVPEWKPMSAWDLVVGTKQAALGEEPDPNHPVRVERHEQSVNGRELVRFDTIYIDALGNEKLQSQLWADPHTHLPLRTRRSRDFTSVEPNDATTFVAGVFSFPETGPADIYALGVPSDAEIRRIYEYEDDPEIENRPPELRQLLADAEAAIERFPDRYRLMKWPARAERYSGGAIDVLYRDGKPTVIPSGDVSYRDWRGVKIRQARYLILSDDHPHSYLPRPAEWPQVLEWVTRQTPISLDVSDGEKTFSQHLSFDPEGPALRVSRIPGHRSGQIYFALGCWPNDIYWPYIPRLMNARFAGHYQLIRDRPQPDPAVVLRIAGDGRQTDYYIDPERDHICLKWIERQERGGQWQKTRECELTQLRQLDNKHWWAAEQRLAAFDDSTRGTSSYESTSLIHIVTLESSEFPPKVFDGAELLENARKSNAKIIAE